MGPRGLIRVGTCFFQSDDTQSRHFLLAGVYEKEERFAAEHYIRRDIPVVEFGGSLGVVSCLLNRRLKAPKRHVVVEANPDMLPILTGNRDRNGCKFEILHGAAGGEGKTVRIYFGDGALTASSIAVADHSAEISTVTLEEIVENRGFGRCALISDIEGAEINLIRSEMHTLRSRVEVFIVEFHPSINGPAPVEEAQQLLKDNGFEELWRDRNVFVFRNAAHADRTA
jgi:FkbM family methyltransferase